MSKERRESVGGSALRRAVPLLALLAAAVPPPARAQVNIDQDKSPAHIYTSDCAVCHKATRGLAKGRSRAALTAYLAEHYTSSDSEAAALAAYVLSGGGALGSPPAAHAGSVRAGSAHAAPAHAAPAHAGPVHAAAGPPGHPRDAAPAPAAREAGREQVQGRAGARHQVGQRTRPSMPQPAPAASAAAPQPKPAAAAKPARESPAVSLPATATPSEAPSGARDNIAD